MKILNKIYLILAILFFILGGLQIFRWSTGPGISTFGYFVGLSPALSLFGAYFLSVKVRRNIIHLGLIPICFTTIVFFIFTSIGTEMVIIATKETTDIEQYSEILDKWLDADPILVSHFPKDVPKDAQNIKFSFLPAFMQGGAHIQLRYSTTDNQINNLYTQFSNQQIQSFVGGDTNNHVNESSGVPTSFFYTGDSEGSSFTNDYEIIVLRAESCNPKSCDFKWNHGESSGVAISKEKHEIVYWAESW